MEKRKIEVCYGTGKGKTSLAVGQCIRSASLGKSVIIIQFLKGKDAAEFNFLEKMEPDIKLFRFEKEDEDFRDLLESQKKEEKQNILNGINFARKVIDTGECDLLVLDEVLGLVDLDIISCEDIIHLVELCSEEMTLIMTGQNLPKELIPYANCITRIEREKDEV